MENQAEKIKPEETESKDYWEENSPTREDVKKVFDIEDEDLTDEKYEELKEKINETRKETQKKLWGEGARKWKETGRFAKLESDEVLNITENQYERLMKEKAEKERQREEINIIREISKLKEKIERMSDNEKIEEIEEKIKELEERLNKLEEEPESSHKENEESEVEDKIKEERKKDPELSAEDNETEKKDEDETEHEDTDETEAEEEKKEGKNVYFLEKGGDNLRWIIKKALTEQTIYFSDPKIVSSEEEKEKEIDGIIEHIKSNPEDYGIELGNRKETMDDLLKEGGFEIDLSILSGKDPEKIRKISLEDLKKTGSESADKTEVEKEDRYSDFSEDLHKMESGTKIDQEKDEDETARILRESKNIAEEEEVEREEERLEKEKEKLEKDRIKTSLEIAMERADRILGKKDEGKKEDLKTKEEEIEKLKEKSQEELEEYNHSIQEKISELEKKWKELQYSSWVERGNPERDPAIIEDRIMSLEESLREVEKRQRFEKSIYEIEGKELVHVLNSFLEDNFEEKFKNLEDFDKAYLTENIFSEIKANPENFGFKNPSLTESEKEIDFSELSPNRLKKLFGDTEKMSYQDLLESMKKNRVIQRFLEDNTDIKMRKESIDHLTDSSEDLNEEMIFEHLIIDKFKKENKSSKEQIMEIKEYWSDSINKDNTPKKQLDYILENDYLIEQISLITGKNEMELKEIIREKREEAPLEPTAEEKPLTPAEEEQFEKIEKEVLADIKEKYFPKILNMTVTKVAIFLKIGSISTDDFFTFLESKAEEKNTGIKDRVRKEENMKMIIKETRDEKRDGIYLFNMIKRLMLESSPPQKQQNSSQSKAA